MEEWMQQKSLLEVERARELLHIPRFLRPITRVEIKEGEATGALSHQEELRNQFPHLFGQPILQLDEGPINADVRRPLRVGVLFSGGQAPGGHNVIVGIFASLKGLDAKNTLIGFLGGPSGLTENKQKELSHEMIVNYRNTGGFDLIGSGRTKIETQEQFNAALTTVQALRLDGLIIIGGDDSNTNAALLAEFFLQKECQTKVIGVPKTIDGDLKNAHVEASFGFDTASKLYSELIGNIERDALSAKKYMHFIKLMGRSASHITLECALQTHPNLALISEEVAAEQKTLYQITEEIADLICKRSEKKMPYGVILIPEGLIEFVPEMKQLIKELNVLSEESPEVRETKLSAPSKKVFGFLPPEIRQQLLLDRDPHGNVQVSHIETEKLLIHLVKDALKKRPSYKEKFHAVSHFFGYEGRAAFPSYFDAHYCFALGHVATALIQAGRTGYMASIRGLTKPVEEWTGEGVPLTALMTIEERKGKAKPVIQKALVDLNGEPFKYFASQRQEWALDDHFRFPGPLQFYGAPELTESTTFTLQLEQGAKIAAH